LVYRQDRYVVHSEHFRVVPPIMPSIPPPFDALWFRLAIGLVVGLALGSFTTMLSYRLPRRFSIILPRSHCPQCKAVLKTRDLVPVFSWLFARGKCRACGAKIGARYPVIELATALGSMIAFWLMGFQPTLFVALLAVVAIVTAAVIVFECGKN
jgi:leader peptidase (prepilin peptidase)/N-methyltransferase